MALPNPESRKEKYLNAIAGGETKNLPDPITREEIYLSEIYKSVQSGGGGSGGGGGGGETVILYNETGQNTDGAMTQKATTDAINNAISGGGGGGGGGGGTEGPAQSYDIGGYNGVDLVSVFGTEEALFQAIEDGDFSKIHIGDYITITLNGEYYDYGNYTVPSGVEYFEENTLETSAGTTESSYSGSYVNKDVVSFSLNGTKYVSVKDCLDYSVKNLSKAVMVLEVAAINPYYRYGSSGDISSGKKHVLFISRDCLPTSLKYRKSSDVLEGIVGEETFTGDGTTDKFTLSDSSYWIGDVYVNGTKKSYNSHYTPSNGYVTFKSGNIPKEGEEVVIEAIAEGNPWLNSALYRTLNDEEHGILHLIQTDYPTLYEHIYKGKGRGMQYYSVARHKYATSTMNSNWYDRGIMFLPKEDEVWGRIFYSPANANYTMLQLPIFTGSRKHISKGLGNNGSRTYWWLGSVYSSYSSSFCGVYSFGYPDYTNASYAYGVPICFLVS